MTDEVPLERIYAGSDGRYYSDPERERNVDSGAWKRCLRDDRSGRELVETPTGALLLLDPIPPAALPRWIELRTGGGRGVRLVDTRRTLPPGIRPATVTSACDLDI